MLRRLPVIVLLLSTALAAASASAASAAVPRIDPIRHSDELDVVGGPLDVTIATFGQQEARLRLYLQTRAPFHVGDLDPATGRSLCLELYYAPVTTLRSRVCVVPGNGSAALRYETIDQNGQVSGSRALDTPVNRPDERTVEASFTAVDADLPRQKIGWRIATRWVDGGGCSEMTPCTDLAPDAALFTETLRLVAGPRCLGAASRDPRRSCVNRNLRYTVFPRHKAAKKIRNAYCDKQAREGTISFCAFGVTPSRANEKVALVGDSHAAHWRGALEVVAQSKRWRGLTMMKSGCPLTRAKPILPSASETQQCRIWNDEVQAWFRRHPEVRTVIVAAHRGNTKTSARAGYHAAWKMLPDSVKRIIVIRGAPVSHVSASCIRRAVIRHKRPGLACAESTRTSIRSDPEAAAARSYGSSRVKVVDLTRYFCGRRVCYPVIGGLLVHKDGVHLTRVFASTLGPFMLRAVNRATG
ncbi:MAG: SGNH hydrolase domain-containing protein [Solirubrobacteraceae bacterium]